MSSVMKGKCFHTRSQCCHRESVREFRLPLERAVGASRPRRAAEPASRRGAKASPGLGRLCWRMTVGMQKDKSMERSRRATTRVAPTKPRMKRLSRPVHSRGDPRGRPAGGWESPLNRIRQQSLGILPLAHRVAHLVAKEQRFPPGNFLTYK